MAFGQPYFCDCINFVLLVYLFGALCFVLAFALRVFRNPFLGASLDFRTERVVCWSSRLLVLAPAC